MLEKGKTRKLAPKHSHYDHVSHSPQHHNHPSHEAHLPRLKRVKGQIEGIEGMITGGRYCPDIIAQLRAASAALKAIEAEVFKTHLRGCVKSAFLSKDAFAAEQKIDEVMKMIF